eukprot:2707677-Rhodomonas_salina.1
MHTRFSKRYNSATVQSPSRHLYQIEESFTTFTDSTSQEIQNPWGRSVPGSRTGVNTGARDRLVCPTPGTYDKTGQFPVTVARNRSSSYTCTQGTRYGNSGSA